MGQGEHLNENVANNWFADWTGLVQIVEQVNVSFGAFHDQDVARSTLIPIDHLYDS